MSYFHVHNINWCLGDGATLRLANNVLWSVRRAVFLMFGLWFLVWHDSVQNRFAKKNRGESQGCNNKETGHRKVMNFEWAVVDRVFMHGF